VMQEAVHVLVTILASTVGNATSCIALHCIEFTEPALLLLPLQVY
jgi:hypothetical protein